jgi:hypothetical protein
VTKDEQLAALLAEGWALNDLVWMESGSPVSVELVYVKGQDAVEELRKALDQAQAGQWLVKAEAVERRIRTIPGCEKYSLKRLDIPECCEVVRGSR